MSRHAPQRESTEPRSVRPPSLPRVLEPASVDAQVLQNGERIEEAQLEDLQLEGLVRERLEWSELRATATNLAHARLSRGGFYDVEMERPCLANATFLDLTLQRVGIRDGQLTGVALAGCLLRDVTVDGSRLDLASFRGSTLERVRLSGCRLHEADLTQATFRDVVFEDCDLTLADFSNARVERSVMRGCTLERLRGAAGLRGVAMPWSDLIELAPALADALGIRLLQA